MRASACALLRSVASRAKTVIVISSACYPDEIQIAHYRGHPRDGAHPTKGDEEQSFVLRRARARLCSDNNFTSTLIRSGVL